MSVIVCPLHWYFSTSHLEHVVEMMKRLGPPLIDAVYDELYNVWFALEGTHRLRAAQRLGVAPIIHGVGWPRRKRALERARFATIERGLVFPRVEVAFDQWGVITRRES